MSSENQTRSGFVPVVSIVCSAVITDIFARLAPDPQLALILSIDAQGLILYNKWKKENIIANI